MIAASGHTYAQIVNGTVFAVFTAAQMPEWNANQITVADITGVTPAPAVGWTATGTSGAWAFAAPPAPPVPTLAQQAAELIAGGLTVTSTEYSALNGVYTVQSGVPFGQEQIANEAQFISTYNEFTNGATTNLSWPLLNATFVTFPTTAEFLAFAKVVGQFIAAVTLATGQGGTLPTATATIP